MATEKPRSDSLEQEYASWLRGFEEQRDSKGALFESLEHELHHACEFEDADDTMDVLDLTHAFRDASIDLGRAIADQDFRMTLEELGVPKDQIMMIMKAKDQVDLRSRAFMKQVEEDTWNWKPKSE